MHLPASATLKLELYHTTLDPSHSSRVTGTQKDNKRTATLELLWDSKGECTLATQCLPGEALRMGNLAAPEDRELERPGWE